MRGPDAEFGDYFESKMGGMRATAYLLCGDWHLAEDLVQIAFTKLYLAWPRVARRDVLDQYLRRVLVRSFIDEKRRGWWRRESTTDELPDAPGPAADAPEERMVLWRVLAEVPPRQRAALVLRYWEDLSIEETAELLECSVGNIKSQTARGLQTLRALLERDPSNYRDAVKTA
ncbi:MAG TPA: SigE family RNA polymerase sigma factor [Mycobacteriales bacterium]|nr:SigE family RNA polymerase sigma factor [Mycobacteriales bacterium]